MSLCVLAKHRVCVSSFLAFCQGRHIGVPLCENELRQCVGFAIFRMSFSFFSYHYETLEWVFMCTSVREPSMYCLRAHVEGLIYLAIDLERR